MAETKRRPGRRPPIKAAVRNRHIKAITAADKDRRDLQKKADQSTTKLAQKISAAIDADVPTNDIAEELGYSRQMVYKLVRDRVDKKPLKSSAKPSKNASKPKS